MMMMGSQGFKQDMKMIDTNDVMMDKDLTVDDLLSLNVMLMMVGGQGSNQDMMLIMMVIKQNKSKCSDSLASYML